MGIRRYFAATIVFLFFLNSFHKTMAFGLRQSTIDSPILYSLLKQKFEIKQKKHANITRMVRTVVSMMLAFGSGLFGATLLDSYMKGKPLNTKNWFWWIFDKLGKVVEQQPKSSQQQGTGIKVEAGVRLRTPEELKNIAFGGAEKKQQATVVNYKTYFKPLFCLTTIGAYFFCRFLLREQPTPFYDVLLAFVADWKTHKVRTPKEFHQFFNKLYLTYEKQYELMMSEDVAMTIVRQVMMICTSRISDELGVDDNDANRLNVDAQREAERVERESLWQGWQLLPTLCKFFVYFFI